MCVHTKSTCQLGFGYVNAKIGLARFKLWSAQIFLAVIVSIFTVFLSVVYICAGHIDRTHYFCFPSMQVTVKDINKY